MNKTTTFALLVIAAANWCVAAPDATISNKALRVRMYLPDAENGFYRGTRFDWAGVIGSLEFAGHNFYPQWFDRRDDSVRDFIFDGDEIIAGPCTAITGPAEEFPQVLGYDEAQAGGSFVKIGVGVLRKVDGAKYDPFRLYPTVDGGKWNMEQKSGAIEFRHQLNDAAGGYGYDYRKAVLLAGDTPQMSLHHRLRNTGKRTIRTSVYNHNFMYLDRQPPGPGLSLTFPFELRMVQPAGELVTIQGNKITFSKTLTRQDRVFLNITGFGSEAGDYDFRIEDQRVGAGVRITGDRPLARLALWAIRAPTSLEPFIDIDLAPGEEFTWRINYDYYTVPKGRLR